MGVEYTTSYVWDDWDRLEQMIMPSGRVVTYRRDSVRRIAGISATVNGARQSIVNNIHYRADNQMTGCTYGNGLTDSRSYDLQGRLLSQELTGTTGTIDTRTYSYDIKSNITAIEANGNSISYDYDALDRLKEERAQPDTTDTSHSYDLNHNRQQKINGDTTEFYSYHPGSNRLQQLDETGQQSGTTTAQTRYEYNNAGRLWRYYQDETLIAEYIYNASGQRTRKILYAADGTEAQTIIYHW